MDVGNKSKYQSKKSKNYAGIYQRQTIENMFKKIIEKLGFGSCKTKTTNDVNAFKESEKKSEEKSK